MSKFTCKFGWSEGAGVRARMVAAVLFVSFLAPRLSFAAVNGRAQNAGMLDARNYSNLDSALSAVPQGGTLNLLSNYVATLNVGLVVKTRGVTIHCDPGASIVKHGNFAMITVEADDVTVEGCVLDGAQASGYKGAGILVTHASHFRLTGLTVKNLYGNGIYLVHATDGMIDHNTISGMAVGDGIFGENETSRIVVDSNLIDRSTATQWGHAIGFHSTKPGPPVSQITIANNDIYNGNSFCVEIGSFGSGTEQGSLTRGIVVSGNNCRQAPPVSGDSDWGGYSFAGTDGIAVTGNVYDNDVGYGHRMGIELVSGVRATITGNTVWGADTDFNNQSYSIFSNNNVFSLFPRARNDAGFYLGGSNPGGDNDFDTVEDNIIARTWSAGRASWAPRHYYNPGTMIRDGNGNLEMAVSKSGQAACTSGASAPAWSQTHGGYTTDNECEWQSVARAPTQPVEYSGIWLQCNGSEGAECEHDQILNNEIIDNQVSQRPALYFENDSDRSAASDIVVAGNQIVGWQACYSVNRHMGTVYIHDNDEGCMRTGLLSGGVVRSTIKH